VQFERRLPGLDEREDTLMGGEAEADQAAEADDDRHHKGGYLRVIHAALHPPYFVRSGMLLAAPYAGTTKSLTGRGWWTVRLLDQQVPPRGQIDVQGK